MLDCIFKIFNCKFKVERAKIGVIGGNLMEDKYSDLIVPANYTGSKTSCLIYDSVNALLEADYLVFKRSKDIMEDFFTKFSSASLVRVLPNHQIAKSFEANHAVKLLNSVLDSPFPHNGLQEKIQLFFNIALPFSKSIDKNIEDNILDALNTFFRTVYVLLIKRVFVQTKINADRLDELLRGRMTKDRGLLKASQLNASLVRVQKFFSSLRSNKPELQKFTAKDLKTMVQLLDYYNQISINPDEKLSDILIIFSCYSVILEKAEKNAARSKKGININYKELNASITNIIIYFLKLYSSFHPHMYEMAFKRCLIQLNLMNFNLIMTRFSFLEGMNFFDFDYKCLQSKLLLDFILCAAPLCEQEFPGGDFQVKDTDTMNYLISLVNEAIQIMTKLENEDAIEFDQNVRVSYALFLARPESLVFLTRRFNELFNFNQIEDMILFNMIREDEVESIYRSQEPIIRDLNQTDTNPDLTNADIVSTSGNLEVANPCFGFDLLSNDGNQQDLQINQAN